MIILPKHPNGLPSSTFHLLLLCTSHIGRAGVAERMDGEKEGFFLRQTSFDQVRPENVIHCSNSQQATGWPNEQGTMHVLVIVAWLFVEGCNCGHWANGLWGRWSVVEGHRQLWVLSETTNKWGRVRGAFNRGHLLKIEKKSWGTLRCHFLYIYLSNQFCIWHIKTSGQLEFSEKNPVKRQKGDGPRETKFTEFWHLLKIEKKLGNIRRSNSLCVCRSSFFKNTNIGLCKVSTSSCLAVLMCPVNFE